MADPISLLIIKGSNTSFIDAEAYVKNRGMVVKSVTDMREAMEYIVKHTPQYVLVAVDHPNKKVKLLPKLLAQSLPVKVVMIAESASPSSILILQALNHPHIILPPVTGSAIERTLQKMRKTELEEMKEQERQRIMASYAGTNDTSRPGFYIARGTAADQLKAVQAPAEERTRTTRPLMESEHIRRPEKKTATYHGGDAKNERHQSLMVRGAIEAMDAAVQFDDSINLESVSRVSVATNVSCITVESPRFSGYLIAAMGKDRGIDQAFIETVKTRLFNFLKANGEAPKNEDTLSIKIREVEFEDWALAHAEFLRKTIHGADEVAMAFFPHEQVSARLEDSADESMVKISLDEIRDDVPLEFDVYLYMPKNKRYVLYSPQGRKLLGAQKIRLQEKGVRHMHLKKDAIADVKRYRAQNFLNARIEEFQAKAA